MQVLVSLTIRKSHGVVLVVNIKQEVVLMVQQINAQNRIRHGSTFVDCLIVRNFLGIGQPVAIVSP